MFIYLLAMVAIVFSIFGLTYSRTSLRAIENGDARLSTIELPSLLRSTSLTEHHETRIDGNNGIATGSSQQSLEISSEAMEEANNTQATNDVTSKEDPRDVERNIFDQKIRDAKQFGLAESLWPMAPHRESDKAVKDIINQKYVSDGSKPVPQRVHTNTIFNMIQYETLQEAMAVLQKQQEEEEAARAAANEEQFGKTVEK